MLERTSPLNGGTRAVQGRVRTGAAVMAVILCFAVSAGVGCKKPEKKAVKEHAVNVQVGKAESRSLRPFVESVGTLNPYEMVNVSSELDGILQTIHVDDGSVVTSRQVIAEIKETDYRLAVEQAAAILKQAEAALANVKQEHERKEALYREELVTKQQYDDIVARLAVAQGDVERAAAGVDLAKEKLTKTRIHAPMAGSINQKKVTAGDYVRNGTLLVSIIRIDLLKLSFTVSEKDVGSIREAGVEIRYGVEIGKEIKFADIRKDYDAVFIGVGAQGSSPMGVDGEEKNYRGFISGVQYLLDINLGRDPYPEGKKVVVVGGGNVAIDCVRSSFRIGKPDVNLVYRRSKAEMPADPVEIQDAEEEKVNFHYLCNPTKILEKDGKVVGVECIRMELGEPDQSGRRRPVPVPGSEFIIETDILIPAIGQKVDCSFLEEADGVRLSKWKTVDSDAETFATSQPGVFASGDCVTGPDVLVRATGNGKRAAEKIDLYLTGGKVEASTDERFRTLFSTLGVYNKKEKLGVIGGLKRAHLPMIDPDERKQSFREVEAGYTAPVAQGEAARCLRCYRIGMIALG